MHAQQNLCWQHRKSTTGAKVTAGQKWLRVAKGTLSLRVTNSRNTTTTRRSSHGNLASGEREAPSALQTRAQTLIRISLQRHAFALKLRYPCLHAAFSLVIFVVLVQGKPKELAVLLTLGLGMLVTLTRHVAEHLGASGRKG